MKQTLTTLLMLSLLLTGCRSLDPSGPYKGDKVLYDADTVIASSYDIMHTYVKWEYDNRANVSLEVTRSADNIRKNGQKWIWSAIALRETYKASPAPNREDALNSALAILRTAMLEATKYMASNPTP
jgi:hypothetical protein